MPQATPLIQQVFPTTRNGLVKLKRNSIPTKRKSVETKSILPDKAKLPFVSQLIPPKVPNQKSYSTSKSDPQDTGVALTPNRQIRRAFQASGIDLSGDGYLRLKEVLSVYPVSRASWYAGLAMGLYPPSVHLGKRAVGWTRESIRNLIANPPKF